jgi:hypothetical protein
MEIVDFAAALMVPMTAATPHPHPASICHDTPGAYTHWSHPGLLQVPRVLHEVKVLQQLWTVAMTAAPLLAPCTSVTTHQTHTHWSHPGLLQVTTVMKMVDFAAALDGSK